MDTTPGASPQADMGRAFGPWARIPAPTGSAGSAFSYQPGLKSRFCIRDKGPGEAPLAGPRLTMIRAYSPPSSMDTTPGASPQADMGRVFGPWARIPAPTGSAGSTFSYQPGPKPRVCIRDKGPGEAPLAGPRLTMIRAYSPPSSMDTTPGASPQADMGRAFGPWARIPAPTGSAGSAFLYQPGPKSRVGPWNGIPTRTGSAGSAFSYQPGPKPRVCIRDKGPGEAPLAGPRLTMIRAYSPPSSMDTTPGASPQADMGRAFGPWARIPAPTGSAGSTFSYQPGPKPRVGPWNGIPTRTGSAGSAFSYQPGAKPRVCIRDKGPRAEGPLHRVLTQSRWTGPSSNLATSHRPPARKDRPCPK